MAGLAPSWSNASTVAGFAQSEPNAVLMRFAEGARAKARGCHALDIGCGAARNALPLARQGWHVVGVDLSAPMLTAAACRLQQDNEATRALFVRAAMDALPVADGTIDLIVAHGVWNLAHSSARFRQSVREAARVAAPGAALFVFTFSRHTLPAGAAPVAGEPFVFTQFSGERQCFLTEEQLVAEMAAAGFSLDPAVPLSEYNRRAPGSLAGGGPVIYEAAFRYR